MFINRSLRSLSVRSVLGIVAAIAAMAIAVPVANAVPGSVFIPTAQAGEGPNAVRDKLGEIGAWAVPSTPSRQNSTRPGERLTGADRSWLAVRSSEPHVTSPPNSFDWGDAGIGTGAAAAALLLVTGSVVAIRKRVASAH